MSGVAELLARGWAKTEVGGAMAFGKRTCDTKAERWHMEAERWHMGREHATHSVQVEVERSNYSLRNNTSTALLAILILRNCDKD